MESMPAVAPHIISGERGPGPQDFAPVSQMMHTSPIPWVGPGDISNTVLFFASDESRYVTGVQPTQVRRDKRRLDA